MQFAERLAGALDSDPAAATLLRFAPTVVGVVALVLSPAVSAIAAGQDLAPGALPTATGQVQLSLSAGTLQILVVCACWS
jgi:hypothetical protein